MRPRFAALIPLVLGATSGVCGAQRIRQTPPPTLTAPAGVTATPNPPAGVTVTWQAAFGAAQYQLLRSPDPTIPGTPIGAPITTTSTVDPAPLPTVAYYQVVSIAPDGRQNASPPTSYTPPPPTTTAQIATRGSTYATKVGPSPTFEREQSRDGRSGPLPRTDRAGAGSGPGHRDPVHVLRSAWSRRSVPPLSPDRATAVRGDV